MKYQLFEVQSLKVVGGQSVCHPLRTPSAGTGAFTGFPGMPGMGMPGMPMPGMPGMPGTILGIHKLKVVQLFGFLG